MVDGSDALIRFLRSETAAVTVDWVVLTAGIAGLGLATASVVIGGIGNLSHDIASALFDMDIGSGFDEALQALGFASLDFSGDAGGFSGGALVSFPGIGDVLQIGPDQTASASFAMPDGAAQAMVEFDLFGLDSLNDEAATISINGEIAGTVTVDNGVASFVAVNGGTTAFEAFTTSQGTDLNGDGSPDSVTQIRMTVGSPGEALDLQIHSGAGAGVDNESFAIDNVNVSAG